MLKKTKEYLKTLRTHLKMIRQAWRELRKNNAYVAPTFKLPTSGLYDDQVFVAQAHFLKMRWDTDRKNHTRDNMTRFIQGVAAIRAIAKSLAAEPTRYEKLDEESWFKILTGWQLQTKYNFVDREELKGLTHTGVAGRIEY